ncbi:MAG: hypothetical protein DHS20C18_25140 [Saprospiraceae bacterium]|nr:MAG: hypothetical protein DHS20C18_25140 [Saprospiraceae bacterium]
MKSASSDEFYIGYLPKAPASIARATRWFIFFLILIVPVIAFLITAYEKDFSTATFDFGQPSRVTGTLTLQPVPMLIVNHGTTPTGEAIEQSILLIGFGKAGAEHTLETMEKEQGRSLEGKQLELEGSLIYHDGKTLLELTKGKAALIEISENTPPIAIRPKPMGSASFVGEIADPKCYFGVMKPGEGKPHRSCAARCIAGGIPPVLKAADETGAVNYYLVLGSNGEKINDQVLPFVGKAIRLDGDVEKWGDWYVIKTTVDTKISPLFSLLGTQIPLCNAKK